MLLRAPLWARVMRSVNRIGGSFREQSRWMWLCLLPLLFSPVAGSAEPLKVQLSNAISGARLADVRLDAFRLKADGRKEWVGRAHTDTSGVAHFDIERLGDGGEFFVKTRIYGSTAYSDVITRPGRIHFKVGKLRLKVVSGATGNMMANARVHIREVLPNGKTKWAGRGTTDGSGIVHLDPVGLGSGRTFVAKTRSEANGSWQTSESYIRGGAYTFTVGNKPLLVTMKNALTGRVVANQRIDAFEFDGKTRRWVGRARTDQSGLAVFDIPGLGAGRVISLKARPYGPSAWTDPIDNPGRKEFLVGKLQLTVVDANGDELSKSRVDIREVLAGGKTKWVTRGKTDDHGVVRLDPFGLGSGKLFVAHAASPVTGKWKSSDPFKSVGDYVFQVGNEALNVTLTNALSGKVLANQRIDAFEFDGTRRRWVGRAHTDDAGQARFDIDGLGEGRKFVLKARPYGVWAYSDVLSETGDYRFEVGKLRLKLVSGADGKALVEHKVHLRELLNDGKSRWVSRGRTDANGIVHFDPVGLDAGRKFVAYAASPSNGSRKVSEPYGARGEFKFVVGNKPLVVKLVDGISGKGLSGIRIGALERLDAKTRPKWRGSRRTDENGYAVFDLDGLGSGRTYVLQTRPFNGGSVWSHDFTEAQKFTWKVGTSPITLFDKDENVPLAGVKLIALRQDAAGKLRWYRSGKTDGRGVVRFDLPGISPSVPYVMKAYSPFGNGAKFYSTKITKSGPFRFAISREQDPNFDGEPPTIIVRAPAPGAVVSAAGFQVSGTATDNKAVASVAVDVGESGSVMTIAASVDARTGAFTANVGAVPEGSLPITVRATDAAGNIGTNRFSVQAAGDSAAPTITIASHATGDTVPSTGFQLAGTVADDVGVTALTVSLVSEGQTTIDAQPVVFDAAGNWSYSVGSGAIAAGPISISMQAGDAVGNVTVVSIDLEVTQVDPSIRQLIDRITFGATPQLIQDVTDASAFLDEQLNPAGIDDSAFEGSLPPQAPGSRNELQERQVFYAVGSRRQLRELMTWFWDNHFSTNINARSNDIENTVAYEWAENQAFRANALGRFRDLLEISAKSPSMSIYLNGNSNVVGNPNENYSRELMELHTLKVDGGYTQDDVEEVARVFTGWQFNVSTGAFVFNAAQHDFGPKTVLGQNIPANLQNGQDGEMVLDILTNHPSTAKFICEKLITLLVTDEPPTTLVSQCSQTFQNTVDDTDQIAQVVRSLVESAEFQDPANARSKIKNPLELAASAVRNFGASGDLTDLRSYVRSMGMLMFDYPVPTGVPEVGEPWINSSTLLERMKFVDSLAFSAPSNSRLGLDPMAFFDANGVTTADAIVDFVLDIGMNGDATPLERSTALEILNQGGGFDWNAPDAEEKLRSMMGVVLSYPAYQQH
ncbi:MAG: DUF1800 family protein [Pseudomonadota bacterium]